MGDRVKQGLFIMSVLAILSGTAYAVLCPTGKVVIGINPMACAYPVSTATPTSTPTTTSTPTATPT